MPISDIVNVTILANAVTPTRQGFGIPLILTYTTVFPERARDYTSLAGMVADGFTVTDPAYLAAQAIFAQNPRPTKVVVGRCANAPTQKIRFTPVAQNSTLYRITINGVNCDYTSDASATVAEITAGLTAAINGSSIAAAVTATDNTTSLDVQSDTAGLLFRAQVANRALITQADTTPDPGTTWSADLDAVQLYNNEWYCVIPTCASTAIALALAAHVEALPGKILAVVTADDAELAGTGMGNTMKAAAYARTLPMYHHIPWQYPNAAWAGKILPLDPGSATWAYKTLAGITVDPGLTATQETNLKAKNMNYYLAIAGLNVTRSGITPSGEFIDLVQGIDWLTARLQERIFGLLASVLKIPYTDPGIQSIEAEVRAQLNEGIGIGFLAADPAPVVTVPKAADVSASDKTNRILNNVNFQATTAGAVHAVTINGTVSV